MRGEIIGLSVKNCIEWGNNAKKNTKPPTKWLRVGKSSDLRVVLAHISNYHERQLYTCVTSARRAASTSRDANNNITWNDDDGDGDEQKCDVAYLQVVERATYRLCDHRFQLRICFRWAGTTVWPRDSLRRPPGCWICSNRCSWWWFGVSALRGGWGVSSIVLQIYKIIWVLGTNYTPKRGWDWHYEYIKSVYSKDSQMFGQTSQ